MDRQGSNPEAFLAGRDDRSFAELLLRRGEHLMQDSVHIVGPLVLQPENDDARQLTACSRGDLREIEVERQNNSLLLFRFGKDFLVSKAL